MSKIKIRINRASHKNRLINNPRTSRLAKTKRVSKSPQIISQQAKVGAIFHLFNHHIYLSSAHFLFPPLPVPMVTQLGQVGRTVRTKLCSSILEEFSICPPTLHFKLLMANNNGLIDNIFYY